MEQVNLGNEDVQSSKRRLSSILKASRTSMKVPGVEQEEKQEEVTKPIEKKRNSRRVSFATTKNVRLFSSDGKSESPILASVQNTAVEDHRQDEKILHLVEEGKTQIKGLDTLLNTPLYVSQHLGRGNFFSDPVLQDDCVDKTMLLGEEAGYMDMTHSHTITIDKDYEISEVNTDFDCKAAGKAIGHQNVAGQTRLSCGTKVETKNPNMDLDFNAFLTSISLPTVKNPVPSSFKKELGDTNLSEIDKENHLPPFLLKQGNPQPKGLQRRRSHVAFFEGDDMEVTKSHTAVIENRGNAQPILSIGPQNVAGQMRLSCGTKVETKNPNMDLDFNAFLNSMSLPTVKNPVPSSFKKELGDTNMSEIDKENHLPPFLLKQGNPQPKGLQRRRSRVAFFEGDDMEVTKSHTAVIENRGNSQPILSFVSGNNESVATTVTFSHDDDMDLTQSQTAAINVKLTGNISRNIQSSLDHSRSHYFSENDDAMEMTGMFNVSCREKEHAISMKEETSISKASKISYYNVPGNGEIIDRNKPEHFQSNLSIIQMANSDDMEKTEALDVSVQEKEHTASIKNESFLFPKISKKSTFNVIGNAVIVDQNKSSHLSISQADNCDDMEMTQCQTIVFEAKPFSGDKQLINLRKSLPHASMSGSVQDENIKKEALPQIHKPGRMSSINLFRNEDLMRANKSGNFSIAQTADSDDMVDVSVQEKENTASAYLFPQISKNATIHVTGKTLDINKLNHFSTAQASNFDDMDMTQCQTIVLESKQCNGDRPLNNSQKSLPHVLPPEIQNSDGMDMTQAFTRRIVLNAHSASKKGKGQNISYSKTTSSRHDQSDLTGEPSTFAGIASPSMDEMELTGCATVNIDSNRTWLAANTTSTRRAPSFTNQTITVAEPMEMTEVHMLPDSERKAFTHSKNIEVDNYQKNISNPDDMKMTQCQTVVLEAENAVSYTSGVDDEIEFTGCKTIAIDTPGTLAATGLKIKATESALWASTFLSCPESSREQNEVSEAAKRGITHEVYHSEHNPFTSKSSVDDANLKCTNSKTKSYSADDMQLEGKTKMTHPTNAMTTQCDEDYNMPVTKVITMPIETQDGVVYNQREVANVETSRNEEKVADCPEQSADSVQLELSSAESVADSFIKEELRHAQSRRRSLVDFQIKLQNMSRRLNEEVLKEATAPLPSCFLSEISHKDKEQCETTISTEPAPNVTPNMKRKDKPFPNDKATPFSLKKQAFSSRVSFGGIMPKLPQRATAITPNKTITPSTHDLQCFQMEKCLDVEQNSNCETVNINDEEFPEMSSEEDISAGLENWPIHKEEERVDSLAVHKNEEPLENDVFESDVNTSQGLKRPYMEEANITAENNKKAYISDMGSVCHEAGIQWEGNFTTQRSAKTREDTGVFESTLRSSQYESRIDGTFDYEFDFNKKLEDGSITMNEFLSHFGINFVIHRSRPSALPESCRAGETRTMEDLLKEKYIYHPKQGVYEQDCKELTDIVERLKEQMPIQEKSLRCINGALQQEMCTLSKEQLKSFGSMLKARRVYFGKRSKAVSHEMKGALYSQLIKTTQDAKQQMMAKIKETDDMMEDLNGCISDLETELAAIDAVMVGNNQNFSQIRPDLKAKEDDLHKLNSDLSETQRETDELQIQLRTLEGQGQKLREECSSFKSDLATLNSLNEWHLDETDKRGALFTFLHKTVHLQVKLQTPAGKEWVTEDVERNMDVSLHLQLDMEKSECHASMVHKLLALHNMSQTHWMQKYPTTKHIPELLHDVSLVVSRLRLLGEEIHRLKKWGGLRLCIRQISCVDTQIHIILSSLKAYEKFEFSLMVTPDYPFGPLQIQNFRSHIGNTRLSQIEVIVSSVRPGKNYLTNILKNIHSDLLH